MDVHAKMVAKAITGRFLPVEIHEMIIEAVVSVDGTASYSEGVFEKLCEKRSR